MSDFTPETGFDEKDEATILAEIEESIREQRSLAHVDSTGFTAQRQGFRFPLVVNAVLLVVAAIGFLLMWRLFLGSEAEYVLRAGGEGGAGADIVAALLAEAEAALSRTEASITEIQNELTHVEARLAALEDQIRQRLETMQETFHSEGRSPEEISRLIEEERKGLENRFSAERQELLARRDELTEQLNEEVQRQQSLSAQVAVQRDALDSSTAETGAQPDDPLQELREQQQLEALFANRIITGYRSFSQAVNRRSWDDARAELVSLADFLSSQNATEISGVQEERAMHGQLIPQLEELLLLAEEGFPEDAAADILPGWAEVKTGIEAAQELASQGNTGEAIALYEAAITSIPGMSSGMGFLTRQAQQRSVAAISQAMNRVEQADSNDPALLLETLTVELGRPGSDIPAPVQRLTRQLQVALSAVEQQREDLARLTSLSEQQLALLRSSVDDGSGGADMLEGTDGSMATVERIAAEIQLLQGRVAESRDRHAAALQQIVELEAANTALRRDNQAAGIRLEQLATRIRTLEAFQESIQALSLLHDSARRDAARELQTIDRQTTNSAFQTIMRTFDEPLAEELFPGFRSTAITAVESLVGLERERAAAEAEERILLQVQLATEKVTEEQIRLLEFSDTTDDSTMDLLTSLVKEIDTMATDTRESRGEVDFARALGVIVSGNPDGTMIVQTAGDIDTRSVQRVFVSRNLSNGERIPIAEAEIVAITRDSIAIRITSTIAPTIVPQKNDVVFTEY